MAKASIDPPPPAMPSASSNYYRDDDDDDGQSDSLPLLAGPEPRSSIEGDPVPGLSSPSASPWKKTGRRNPAIFVLICVILTFTIDFGVYMGIAPQTRIYEDIVCRNYFDKHEPGRFPLGAIPEAECKLQAIQGEVAFVQAMSSSFDAIPSILFLIPYGRLADNPRFGRRLVLLLSLVGIVLNFYWSLFVVSTNILPLRAVWFGSLFTSIGGGLGVTNAMVMTMVTDIVEPDNRTVAFSRTTLSVVVAQLIAPSVSAGLDKWKGPWLPYLLGLFTVSISFPALLIFPETIELRPAPLQIQTDENATGDQPSNKTTWLQYPRRLLSRAWESSKFIFQSRPTILLLSTFFLSVLGRKQIDLILLYASTRYQIKISDAAFVLSIFAGGNIFLLLVLIPYASSYLTNTRHFSSTAKDLCLTKISVVLLTAGCFGLGLAPTLGLMICGILIYTLGCGFLPVSLSLVSTFVEPRHSARLYAIVSLVSMIGAFVGGPFLAVLFSWGLSMGRFWTGLPFVGTGLAHVLVILAVLYIKLPKKDEDGSRSPTLLCDEE